MAEAEVVYTGKPKITLMVLSHLGIAASDGVKLKIAQKIVAKYSIVGLTLVENGDGQEEWCFGMNEFPPEPEWKKGEGILKGIDIVGMATKEFFEEVGRS